MPDIASPSAEQRSPYSPPSAPDAIRKVTVLLLRGAGVSPSLVRLPRHPWLEVISVDDLTPAWRSFARREASAVAIATVCDPFASLAYARRTGITRPLVLAIDAERASDADALIARGATAVVALPLSISELERVLTRIIGSAQSLEPNATRTFAMDRVNLRVYYRGSSTRLTKREFAILQRLRISAGRFVSARQILNYVWDSEERPVHRSSHLVHVYVGQLRAKLARIGLQHTIVTVRGLGYRLQVDDGDPSRPTVGAGQVGSEATP